MARTGSRFAARPPPLVPPASCRRHTRQRLRARGTLPARATKSRVVISIPETDSSFPRPGLVLCASSPADVSLIGEFVNVVSEALACSGDAADHFHAIGTRGRLGRRRSCHGLLFHDRL